MNSTAMPTAPWIDPEGKEEILAWKVLSSADSSELAGFPSLNDVTPSDMGWLFNLFDAHEDFPNFSSSILSDTEGVVDGYQVGYALPARVSALNFEVYGSDGNQSWADDEAEGVESALGVAVWVVHCYLVGRRGAEVYEAAVA